MSEDKKETYRRSWRLLSLWWRFW